MTAARQSRGALLLAAWLAALTAAVILLTCLGHGSLSAPPFTTRVDAVTAWAAPRDPATILVAGVRVAALILAWYLLGTSVAGTAARLSKAARAVRYVDALTLAPVRRLLSGGVGLLLVVPTGVVATAVPVAAVAGAPALAATTPDPPTLTPLTPPDTPTLTPVPVSTPDPPTLALLPPQPNAPDLAPLPRPAGGGSAPVPQSPTTGPSPATTPSPSHGVDPRPPLAGPIDRVPARRPGPATTPSGPAATLGPAATASGPAATRPGDPLPTTSPGPAAGSWTVQPGDSFWQIADAAVTKAWGRPPATEELDPYWRQLVAANRHELADPANADLIFPGQVMAVPPPPPRPAT